MDRRQLFDSLQLDQQGPFDQEIGPEAIVDKKVAKTDRNELLPLYKYSSLREQRSHDRFIGRLQQPGTKLSMNSEPAINRDGGKSFNVHPPPFAIFAFFA